MNQSRERDNNIKFDSDVEADSLRDALWRLTTRVYLLEDFIAEKFGETLSASGYKKSESETTPRSTVRDSSSKGDGIKNVEVPPVVPRSRRGRKRKTSITTNEQNSMQEMIRSSISTSTSDGKNNKAQKKMCYETETANDDTKVVSAIVIRDEKVQECLDGSLTPKDEFVDNISEHSNEDDNFLNEESEDDDTHNDPDFIVPHETEENDGEAKHKTVNQQNTSSVIYSKKFTSQTKSKITYKLARNGYCYSLRSNLKGTNYWYCSKRKECCASLVEKSEDFQEGKKGWSGSFHSSHPPDDKTVLNELVAGYAKQIKLEHPDKSKLEILETVKSYLPSVVQSVVSNEEILKQIVKRRKLKKLVISPVADSPIPS